MNDCPFVVGEVYKTRDGRPMRFVTFIPDAVETSQAVFLTASGYVDMRCADGRYDPEIPGGPNDILPPAPKTVERWVVVMKDKFGFTHTTKGLHESEAGAREIYPSALCYCPIQVPE